MRKFQIITLRLILGLLVTGLLVTGLFALTLSVIPTWGATEAEIDRSLPGDELNTNPNLLWTNAITIDASPEQVWPWIAQIGDTRGGFYSYTFIENQVGKLTGAEGYTVVYTNADEIHPEWQDPQPGEPLIQGSLQVREWEPGRYLLAESAQPSPFQWIWCWYVEPLDGGTTRLISRFSIQVPESVGANPVMDFMLNAGGFIMHQNMMQSIKLRAEGGTEPAWIESAEIILWIDGSAGRTLCSGSCISSEKIGVQPLIVAALSVIVIFVLTFVQPHVMLRVLLDAALVAAVVWSAQKNQTTAAGEKE